MADTREHNIDMSKEDGHQYALLLWSQQPSVRARYPELCMLYHVENERRCTPQQAARRKRMGVKRGVPDLCLPVQRGGYAGLYLELKKPGGRLSESQQWWQEHLELQGYRAAVCYGWEEARKCLEKYLNLPR